MIFAGLHVPVVTLHGLAGLIHMLVVDVPHLHWHYSPSTQFARLHHVLELAQIDVAQAGNAHAASCRACLLAGLVHGGHHLLDLLARFVITLDELIDLLNRHTAAIGNALGDESRSKASVWPVLPSSSS